MTTILTLSILLAIVSVFIAIYFIRQFRGLNQLFAETTVRFEEGRVYNQSLEKKLLNHQNDLESLREKNRKLLAKNEKISAKFKENPDIQAAHASNVHSLESDVEHLNEQVRVMQDQLKEAVSERVVAENALKSSNIEELKTELSTTKENLTQSMTELKEKNIVNEQLESQIFKFEKKYRGIDPGQFYTLKKKHAQYSRLYVGMRGLRDMAEEKSENFQKALLHMSRWILDKQDKSFPKESKTSITELVAKALAEINASYIDPEIADVSNKKTITGSTQENAPIN